MAQSGHRPRAGRIGLDYPFNSPVELMRFTLVYDGDLRPANSDKDRGGAVARAADKHAIRRALHPQLRELWKSQPQLKREWGSYMEAERAQGGPESIAADPYRGERLLHPTQRNAFTFVPLVTSRHHMLCELDILFLRADRDERGRILEPNSGGDLDNRLKVLFDGLKMPKEPNELPPMAAPDADETPFFCLLENDSLISALRVESERLYDVPPTSSHVRLVIRATIKVEQMTMVTMGLLGD